jgi:RNA 2',3'-cyclic 3'-phosphodiesterase
MARRVGRYRLFFALFPEGGAAEKILALGAGLKSRHGLAGKLHLKERLHLTLDHLGDFVDKPADIVKSASEAASELAAQWEGFAVRLDRTVSFGRDGENRPLVLTDAGGSNAALEEFRDRLWSGLAERQLPGPSRKSFTPHVTLLYSPQGLTGQAVDAITWHARELVLVHSALGDGQYEVLDRWPLGA